MTNPEFDPTKVNVDQHWSFDAEAASRARYETERWSGTMTTETLTITDFLLARIAEDERRYTGLNPGDVYGRRLRREVEAKRKMVQEAQDQVSEYFSRFIIETLAAVYADHPDYRDEWRP